MPASRQHWSHEEWLADFRRRFASSHEVDMNTGCWLWNKSYDRSGYGVTSLALKHTGAHRAAFIAFVGPLAPGEFACHKCDTPACVNPGHLFRGDARANAADRTTKGRQSRHIPPTMRGSQNLSAKITEADVLAIREAAGTHKQIAARFGIGPTTVHNIKTRKSWGCVAG